MLVIPAIDIRRGQCVQLVGGKPGTGGKYGDPVEAAVNWERRGASYLHVVDLDAAMGEGDNFNKISEILANVRLCVEIGGGIRTVEHGCELLGIGAERIILGTVVIKSPGVLRELVELAGASRIMASLDAAGGRVLVEGWKEKTGRNVIEVAKDLEELGVGKIFFTNVDKEGRIRGIDTETIRRLVDEVDLSIIAAGGVGSIRDIKRAKEAGAEALVVGTALYEGVIVFEKALDVAR